MKVEAKHLLTHARHHLVKGDVKDAVESMLLFASILEDKTTQRDLSTVLSQLNELEVHERSGTMDKEFTSVQKNRLYDRLMSTIRDLEHENRIHDASFEITTKASLNPKIRDWMEGLLTSTAW